MHPFMANEKGTIMGWQQVASGLAAVWAKENTREALFDAMERKEAYATTGSRMSVRMFGGWNFTLDDLNNREPAFAGYSKGVPMGGELPQRHEAGAQLHGVRTARPHRRQPGSHPDRQGLARWQANAGKSLRRGLVRRPQTGQGWQAAASGQYGQCRKRLLDQYHRLIGAGHRVDRPGFQPEAQAFYYARVLEIPTPRWSTYDAFRFGIEFPRAHRPAPRSAPTLRRSGTPRSKRNSQRGPCSVLLKNRHIVSGPSS